MSYMVAETREHNVTTTQHRQNSVEDSSMWTKTSKLLLVPLFFLTEKIQSSVSFSFVTSLSASKKHIQISHCQLSSCTASNANAVRKYKENLSNTRSNLLLHAESSGSPYRGGSAAPVDSKKKGNKLNTNIAICGGGIAGMSLALSLHDAGFRNVDIYESVTEISEIGVGINIQPSAVRELIELGLGDEMAKSAIPTQEIIYHHINGQEIFREPRGLAAGYKWPQYSIHRGKLLGILHRAVVERLGKDRIHTGHKAINCGNDCTTGASWVEFMIQTDEVNDKKNKKIEKETKTITADLIIGSDGVHSRIRKALTKEGVPRWTGIVMLRGLTKMKPFFTGRSMTIIGPIEREMVIYPISKEAENEGKSLVNWVALKKIGKDKVESLQEKWSVEVEDLDEAIKPFNDFQYDFINVPKMIRNAEKVYQYPMIDRKPLDTWMYGNITLLGDAAHPMIPIGANGATQAIIDGRVLASELYHQKDIASALKAYDTKRRMAVNRIVRANREESETRFLEIIHDQCPLTNRTYDFGDILSEEDLDNISKTYKDVAGFNPQTLNSRESYSVEQVDAELVIK